MVTKENFSFWLEIAKFCVTAATPLIVAYLGLLFLRKIESVKSAISKQSDFDKKWADQFLNVVKNSYSVWSAS
jgi:hypothetical protein